jgi:hypothetical protein
MRTSSLNPQQALFARLVAKGINATEAYIRTYPGDYSRSSAASYQITAERVANAMARLAFTDLQQVAHVSTVLVNGKPRQEVVVKDSDDIHAAAHSAISEIRRGPGGKLTVKLYNKREALMDLARLKGWMGDSAVDQPNPVLKVKR